MCIRDSFRAIKKNLVPNTFDWRDSTQGVSRQFYDNLMTDLWTSGWHTSWAYYQAGPDNDGTASQDFKDDITTELRDGTTILRHEFQTRTRRTAIAPPVTMDEEDRAMSGSESSSLYTPTSDIWTGVTGDLPPGTTIGQYLEIRPDSPSRQHIQYVDYIESKNEGWYSDEYPYAVVDTEPENHYFLNLLMHVSRRTW